jgi:hypothetical protein
MYTKFKLYVNQNFINFDCSYKNEIEKKKYMIIKGNERKEVNVIKISCHHRVTVIDSTINQLVYRAHHLYFSKQNCTYIH